MQTTMTSIGGVLVELLPRTDQSVHVHPNVLISTSQCASAAFLVQYFQWHVYQDVRTRLIMVLKWYLVHVHKRHMDNKVSAVGDY